MEIQPNPIGPLHPFGLRQKLHFSRDPESWYEEAFARHGDPFYFDGLDGPCAVTARPEGVRDLFSVDPQNLAIYYPDFLQPLIGSESIILLTQEQHRAERKAMAGTLFQSDRLRSSCASIEEVVRSHLRAWPERFTGNVLDLTLDITLEVLLRTVLGLRPGDRLRAIRNAILALGRALKPSFLFFPALRRDFGGLSAWARFRRAKEQLESLLIAELEDRRRIRGRMDGHPTDALARLLEPRTDGRVPSQRHVIDQLVTLIYAGHETTAIAMAWAIYELLRNPTCADRLRNELATLGASPDSAAYTELAYTDAICKEALRLHPPAHEIVRRVRVPLRLADRMVPAGAGVLVAVVALHRCADIYPAPNQYRPERFLERSFSPFEFVPFGGGARRCPGAALALDELKIALALIMSHCDLTLAWPRPLRTERRNIVHIPEGGVPVRLRGWHARP